MIGEHGPDGDITVTTCGRCLTTGFPWHTPDRVHPELTDPKAWWDLVEAIMVDACRQLGLPADRAKSYARDTHHRYIDVAGASSCLMTACPFFACCETTDGIKSSCPTMYRSCET